MKKYGFLALIGLCFLISACTDTVSGQVFIDENGNGLYDMKEMGVPYAKILLTRDNDKIAERYTDANGFFDIPIKRKAGRVCVSTDLSFAEANLNYIQESLSKGIPAAAMTVAPLKIKAATATTEEEAEDEEEEATEVTVETPESTTSVQGWVGDQYCEDVKFKGFTALIPVNMDYEAAISAMPERLEVKCYAGAECELVIPYPDGCQLETIYLPQGLSLAKDDQAGISYNDSLNSISFDASAGITGASAQKAATARPAISVGNYRLVILNLKVESDVDIGTTEYKITPAAKCADQTLSLQTIQMDIEREFDLAVYQDLKTMGKIKTQNNVTFAASVENRGRSTVSYGDLTITIIPESADSTLDLQTLPEGCKNYVTKVICRIEEIAPKSTETRTITFKPIIDPNVASGDYDGYKYDVKFFAPGMDTSQETEQVEMKVYAP
ncbi:MAG: hypothetical protein ABH871_08655 [Pseudomonadota bacterium]